jgi:hypothetical protein
MRRVKRRLFTILSALSLLLFVAVCVLWVRGRSGVDAVALTHDHWPNDGKATSRQVDLISDQRLWVNFSWGRVGPRYLVDTENVGEFGPLRWERFDGNTPAANEGFAYVRVGVSHWLPALLLLVPPVLWLNGLRKAHRVTKHGLYPSCGYDLRATPDRCPECGTTRQTIKQSIE